MKQLRTVFSTVRLFAPLPTSSYDTSFVWDNCAVSCMLTKCFQDLSYTVKLASSGYLQVTFWSSLLWHARKNGNNSYYSSNPDFLNLGSIDVWSYMVLLYGDHPAHWRSILALYLLDATLFDNQKCLQILPNAFWESKSCLIEILLQYAIPLSVSLSPSFSARPSSQGGRGFSCVLPALSPALYSPWHRWSSVFV